MMPYLSEAFQDTGGLRTEDVSRISYQLWSAVDHCAKHNVIHRDIKPENVMFCNKQKDSELRIIDFGSGTYDGAIVPQNENGDVTDRHHTFAGSAFYISPEMFQRTYTSKTDVWSAGATLYVLVAGYPADALQQTFNILQSTKKDRSRDLPNMPDNMPDSYYDMLEGALTYKHKGRSSAGQLMGGEFAQFHIQHSKQENGNGTISFQDIAAEAAGGASLPPSSENTPQRTKSVLFEGSVYRHNAYLGYQNFERSVTTLLATMLSKEHAKKLLTALEEEGKRESVKNGNIFGNAPEVFTCKTPPAKTNKEKLQVVTIERLLDILKEMKTEDLDVEDIQDVLYRIRALKDFNMYESFAYHISFLREFVTKDGRTRQGSRRGMDGSGSKDKYTTSSVHAGNVWSSIRVRRGLGDSSTRKGNMNGSSTRKGNIFLDMSVKSASAGMRRSNTATGSLQAMASRDTQ